ncbi:hypothetical protein OF83DRAFT_1171842 [Amylostereum chailletii]|nr:hypothetical protein OF83DRAFT_1171842 [Amylostereum chailletii]
MTKSLVPPSKNSLRCLMGFIIDLTLTMDTVFWLMQRAPLTHKSLNAALRMHHRRKRPIHFSIRTWVDELGSLDRLEPDHAIEKIERLINEHRFDPEGSTHEGEQAIDEAWLNPEELWNPPPVLSGEYRILKLDTLSV